MKKKLLLLALPLMLLSSCGNKQKIALTMDNYHNYIAVYETSSVTGYTFSDKYLNFSGSAFCKFYDVDITVGNDNYKNTVRLNMSGCGQIQNGFHNNYGITTYEIIGVSGYVEVLY